MTYIPTYEITDYFSQR